MNHKGAGHGGTLPVGALEPNGYGLHDMSGNVREWVLDRYDPDFYRVGPPKNPAVPIRDASAWCAAAAGTRAGAATASAAATGCPRTGATSTWGSAAP